MKKAIFIGRFQPLHKGHCHAIKDILQREDIGHLYIIIGSTGKESTGDNPYSYNTRKDMLKKVFKEQIDKKKISVLGLNDCSSDNEWIINLKSIAPDFDIAFTRNDWTRKCLESVCIVEKQKYYDEKHLNGTYIRERIKNRKDIDDLVYEEVLGTINNKN